MMMQIFPLVKAVEVVGVMIMMIVIKMLLMLMLVMMNGTKITTMLTSNYDEKRTYVGSSAPPRALCKCQSSCLWSPTLQ
jgi:hypothetical protein